MIRSNALEDQNGETPKGNNGDNQWGKKEQTQKVIIGIFSQQHGKFLGVTKTGHAIEVWDYVGLTKKINRYANTHESLWAGLAKNN